MGSAQTMKKLDGGGGAVRPEDTGQHSRSRRRRRRNRTVAGASGAEAACSVCDRSCAPTWPTGVVTLVPSSVVVVMTAATALLLLLEVDGAAAAAASGGPIIGPGGRGAPATAAGRIDREEGRRWWGIGRRPPLSCEVDGTVGWDGDGNGAHSVFDDDRPSKSDEGSGGGDRECVGIGAGGNSGKIRGFDPLPRRGMELRGRGKEFTVFESGGGGRGTPPPPRPSDVGAASLPPPLSSSSVGSESAGSSSPRRRRRRFGQAGGRSSGSGAPPSAYDGGGTSDQAASGRSGGGRGGGGGGNRVGAVQDALRSVCENLPGIRLRAEPTTTLKLRKTFRPFMGATILRLGADFNAQRGVWQFRTVWEDRVLGGTLSLVGRELQLCKTWRLSVDKSSIGAMEDLVTSVRFRAAVDLSTLKASARFGFRTERISPINAYDGFTLTRQLPLDGRNERIKLEVKANFALPEPEIEYNTENHRAFVGLGDVEVSIDELNLLLDY